MSEPTKRKPRVKLGVWAIVLALSLAVAAFAAVRLALELRDYSTAEKEYTALRRQFAPNTAAPPSPPSANKPAPTTVPSTTPPTTPPDLSAINPDYIGWLRIEGAGIDYPLVQGRDNEKYLSTTFEGEQNRLGAIFMDSRCEGGLDAPYAILYGHNAKDGSMFGGLHAYLEERYLAEHPELSIFQPDGAELRYRVVAARSTDVTDKAYKLDGMTEGAFASLLQSVGATEETAHLLALSTCVSAGNDEERILVFAVPVG